jgi:hypothetical protein
MSKVDQYVDTVAKLNSAAVEIVGLMGAVHKAHKELDDTTQAAVRSPDAVRSQVTSKLESWMNQASRGIVPRELFKGRKPNWDEDEEEEVEEEDDL